jgi:HK97 gp10 family phage protein
MKMTGGPELARALRSVPLKLAKKQLGQMLRKGAEPFADRIHGAAPKGDPAPPNISDVAISSGRSAGDEFEARVAVGPPKDAYYGYFQEFGFYDVPGKGFVRVAFDVAQDEAQDIVQREVWNAIKDTKA